MSIFELALSAAFFRGRGRGGRGAEEVVKQETVSESIGTRIDKMSIVVKEVSLSQIHLSNKLLQAETASIAAYCRI